MHVGGQALCLQAASNGSSSWLSHCQDHHDEPAHALPQHHSPHSLHCWWRWQNHRMLMPQPWVGISIDALPTVCWSYFHDLVYGLWDIHSLSVPDSDSESSKGDILCHNIIVMDGMAHLDLKNKGTYVSIDHKALFRPWRIRPMDAGRLATHGTCIHAGGGTNERLVNYWLDIYVLQETKLSPML